MNTFHSKSQLKVGNKNYTYYRLSALKEAGLVSDLNKLPFSIRILLENLLRTEDGQSVRDSDIKALAAWSGVSATDREIAFTPARVILQDFTGVPCVVDLAAMRDQMIRMGQDPKKINPLQPVDLVIDHSVQVDSFGTAQAFGENVVMEFSRNRERYQFLKWGQQAFKNFRVVPPGTGIVHQVNLEYLAPVVMIQPLTPALSQRERGNTNEFPSPRLRGEGQGEGQTVYPDTLVGTDSHTVMINGLGVLGWGVGGIEAEAAMLGQPISMLIPEVIGFKLYGKLKEGVTATDLVLTVTQMLRQKGVVGKFVEFYGGGIATLSLADRATLANMAPEYGATMGFFPVDDETLNYLRLTGRDEEHVELVKAYYEAQGLLRTEKTPDPVFSDTLELDLASVESSLAGPKRPQDRVALKDVKKSFEDMLVTANVGAGLKPAPTSEKNLNHGSVVIAAITSCTNTSNPAVMMAAGILAKKAVEKGLTVKPWVKTSLAPGSKVVMEYLAKTGLQPYLEKLRFHLVGYGCTTCIGNSGPLPEAVSKAVKENDLVVAAVLSGNRNFEGRINAQVRANYLASPPLVVAYALAGDVNINLSSDPVGYDTNQKPVYLKDIWPSEAEIHTAMSQVDSEMFRRQYRNVFQGDQNWKVIQIPSGDRFVWEKESTYVRKPPYFDQMPKKPAPLEDIQNARVLAILGDSVTTDHISPAGSIAKDSPAAKYLISQGVEPKEFNSYGARRGNHEVMMRGTFANIRLKNFLLEGVEGPYTNYFEPSPNPLPEGEGQRMFIYDAAMKYREQKTPLIVLAGKEYGSGSSRDWAAKGPALLGVKAVIAESFERIHRSNLIGMGILPLEFSAEGGSPPKADQPLAGAGISGREAGRSRQSFGLTGKEIFRIEGIAEALVPGKQLKVYADEKFFMAKCRIDTPVELAYYQHGGILQYVLRQLSK